MEEEFFTERKEGRKNRHASVFASMGTLL